MHRHQWSDWQQMAALPYNKTEKTGETWRYIRRTEQRCCVVCGALEDQVLVEKSEKR